MIKRVNRNTYEAAYMPNYAINATKLISCEMNTSFHENKQRFEEHILHHIQNGWFIKDSITISTHPLYKYPIYSQLLVQYTYSM